MSFRDWPLRQPFRLQRRLYLRARGDAVEILGEGGGDFDVHCFRPAQHYEEIGVGGGECVAENVLLARKVLFDEGKFLAEGFDDGLARVVGCAAEQRRRRSCGFRR